MNQKQKIFFQKVHLPTQYLIFHIRFFQTIVHKRVQLLYFVCNFKEGNHLAGSLRHFAAPSIQSASVINSNHLLSICNLFSLLIDLPFIQVFQDTTFFVNWTTRYSSTIERFHYLCMRILFHLVRIFNQINGLCFVSYHRLYVDLVEFFLFLKQKKISTQKRNEGLVDELCLYMNRC